MDSVTSFDEENSDSDYMNVSSEEISEEEFEENVSTKRRNLQFAKRKDGPEMVKNSLSKLNIKQVLNQTPVKMSLKRKFTFPSAATKKENDGTPSSSSSISFQLISASQSPEENSSFSIPTTPTMELEAVSNASLLMPAPGGANDEPPYFSEKYGKLCAFCNLGERSQLGQGEMLRLELTTDEIQSSGSNILGSTLSELTNTDEEFKNGNDEINKILKNNTVGGLLQQLNRRQKGLNKCKNPIQTSEYVDELEKIGHQELVDLNLLVENGYFYVHRLCAIWSFGVVRDSVDNTLSGVSLVLQQSLSRKCSFCNHYGASAICKMTCQKAFHFPCIAAAGSFQVYQTSTVFCNDHLGQVPIVCLDDINCRTCSGLGDVSNLMMCTSCGDHYHGLCIGIAQQPGIRAGWQCKTCRICQICRIPDNIEGRSLACENCDKLYHAQCLRPVMATIPKYGWKCRCCRVCSDCGARTPGAGASSRWHNHYTVCDSCYQQRNKGYSCPICRKAYRAAAYREMVKCFICQKFVHSSCDPDADLNAYERRKEINTDYEYTCGCCKSAAQNDRIAAAIRKNNSGEEESFSASQENLSTNEDVDMENTESKALRDDYGLGKGKPFVTGKIAKKRLNLTVAGLNAQRPKGIGKLGFQKRARTFELGRKRGPKSKMRGIFGVPGLGLQRPIADLSKQLDEEPGTENRLILCSAKDRFVLTQDICVMCGAIGTDQEGCLIACAQCGQCYHPYCVSVKVTKEILQKGWRCLDCTVCEGCGEKNDEARLILCDDCDISYHIYCMEPPLDTVPHGTWKCKWCATCFKCGANEPGLNCSWQNSYTECGPCCSQIHCPSCLEVYSDGELIIQCTTCDRWLHCLCDSIKNEADAEKCAEEGYICVICRPKDIPPPHLQTKKKQPSLLSQTSQAKDDSCDETDNIFSLALEGSHYIDGVYLSELGLQQIKSLQTEPKRAKRKPKVNPENEKDAAILAAIESVVTASADNSMEDGIKMELMDPNEEAQIYKDGMEWSSTDPAPEGFSLFTSETGQVVLRKKRQRNLQKLGIGGFSVRNRAVRTKEEEPSNSSAQVSTDETKKKKPNRRKQKNKLVETYPAYLQEAFFGRPLLDSNVKVKLESSSSDEDTKSNVSEDKTIKLSLDELKMIETMRAKQQQKLLEEQKLMQVNLTKLQPNLISNVSQIQLNQKMQSDQNRLLVNFPGSSQNIESMSQTEIKTELGLLDDDENNSDTEALKDVLGLPGDLLDNDLVNTIMNEDDDLSKNANALDDDVKGVKDDLADILSPHFNLDCKDMEDMLFKSVLTDESQESQESMLTNSLTSYSTQSTPSHQTETQQLHQSGTLLSVNMNPLQSPQAMSVSGMNSLINVQSQSPQLINSQINQMNQPIMIQQQPNQIHMQTTSMQPGTSGSMPGISPQRGYFSFDDFNNRNPFNSASSFPNQAQWNASTDSDFELASTSMTSNVNQVPKVNNHQKTAERMAEDEKLGDMSTISAVLYANQNHSELKIEYPQWSDRYKQIMKKWRALSSDKKAPYLQRARDNRSAQQAQLRTKKAQLVAPDLSPDGGTTSTNSTSPALSSTLSETSSLLDVNILQQQQQQQHQTQNISTQPQLIQVDQDKISAQQKSIKEAEQERQWKALQALRAREQQMGMPPDQRMHLMNVSDPNIQLQISTSLNDGSMSPVASPSPNSRNQFVPPSNKGRMMMNPQSPSNSFQHPCRPVSTQLQRQQSQPRVSQSPFSPQATTPQSPHDGYPESPSNDTFSRPSSEELQFMHSPQTSKPVVQQQSPIHVSSANANLSFGQINQNQPQPNIRPLDNIGGYVQAPGTPRPSFNPGQTRTTVYARPDMFSKPPFIVGGQRSDHFTPQPNQTIQSPQDQNNRQLRDLLQRQQAPTNLPSPISQTGLSIPAFSMENDQSKNQQNIQIQQPQQHSQNQLSDNTFRQPLPPGMRQPRMQGMVGGQMIRSTQLVNPQRMIINPDNRPRMGLRPGTVLNPQQMLVAQQQNQIAMPQQRMTLNTQGNFNQVQGEMMQQGQQSLGINDQNSLLGQRITQSNQNIIMQQNIQVLSQGHSTENIQVPTTVNQTNNQNDVEGIPDSVTAELEKLEQDENVGMENVGDILGGLGDDDDDLLDSLTADMGADFNILEYADPELDTTDDEKTNLLDSLELDDSENAKDEKLKNSESEKLSKPNLSTNQHQNANIQQQLQNRLPTQGNTNVINQIPSTVNQLDSQNMNQGSSVNQQGAQIVNQIGGQQIVMNPQGGVNNFQRQQVRIKAIPSNQIPEIQQIHQQMMLQLQQAAANGKPMPLGTRLVSNNNVVGTVIGPNNIQLNFATGHQRLQQVRMVNPNMMQGQGNQNNTRMALPQMPQNRPNIMQNIQQPMNPNIQSVQSSMVNQTMIAQQPQLQQQNAVPPPPPYPEPPPPYPGQSIAGQPQEQPLLLEDLLEQEKREQARHTGSSQIDQIMPNQSQQSILNDMDYEKLRADVLTSTTQSIPQGMTQMQQQPQQQNQFMPRGVINKQWRAQTPVPLQTSSSSSDLVRSVPIFQANLQVAPPIPPENMLTDADKTTQTNYETWLNQQNNSLQEQLRYYETEILELRKLKKSLNTKQRQLKKNGNELTEIDAKTLMQVTQEQTTVQKHLESARKQARNHLATKQDYDAKKSAKQMANIPQMVSSPMSQINEQSPMMSPSPGGMNQNVIQQPVQSPLGNPIMAPSQSPLHSPSPMMSAQSPGPITIMQSPGTHINAMSPYNTMQQSPRIGTPHSHIEDSPFSPNAGSIDSPSISGRLTSPAPRMTSPQHRPSTPMQMMNRMGNNASQFNQQNIVMGQQTRFVRPQQMMQNDSNRIGMRMPGNFQQINQNIIRQSQYNTMDGNQNQSQQNLQMQQNMDPQMRQLQMRQLQMRQQQAMMNQQAQMSQMNQMSQQNSQVMQGQQNQQIIQQNQQNSQIMQQPQQNNQMMQQNPQMMQQVQQNVQMMSNQPNQSPNHQQSQSPLINQNSSSPMPRSPMVHYQQQQHQNPNSPMMMENSPRPSYMQQQHQLQQQSMMDHGNQNMMQGGGGGGNGMHPENNPIPYPPFGRFGCIKLGLRGGAPMWGNNGNGNRKQTSSNAEILQIIKKQQQSQSHASTSREEIQKNTQGKVAPACEFLHQATSSKLVQPKVKTSLLKKPPASIATSKIKSLVSTDYNDDDSSNGTPPISPLSQKNRMKPQGLKSSTDDIVIINVDSSPDEKQRILDYDDDNDKVVTTLTEVSLNSTAQDIGDSDDMIEAFDTRELVSSPLVTESTEATDYALFEPHVVHLDDSNESLKEMMSAHSHLFEEAIEQKAINQPPVQISFIAKPAKDKIQKKVGTREDFEAMIDSGKDDDESETEVVAIEKCDLTETEVTRICSEAQTSKIITAPMHEVKKEVKLSSILSTATSVSITLPANLISRANIQTSIGSAHKKLVKNNPPTTAKVSIGNTTISVPVVLKNMPNDGSKKIITTNPLTISNLKKNPALFSVSGQKINTSTIVTLSLNKGTTRPIQTVQRFQQKPGQPTQSIIVPISSCVTSSPSASGITNIISSVGIVSSAHNSVTSKMSENRTSPILTFSKMSTLTMTQDASLPSKIFEDDEILPDTAIELVNIDTGPSTYANKDLKRAEDSKETSEEKLSDEKLKSQIPVHVIVKSRESSQSPVLNPAQRLLSGTMSQLSPLSRPIEINTNTHNATQQIRSIMSSINSNEDLKNKAENEQTSVVSTAQPNVPKTIIRSFSTPSAGVNHLGKELKMKVTQKNASVPPSPNVQTTQASNILYVKQIRTTSSQNVTLPSSSTIMVMSQSGQIQSQGSVIISNKPSNLLSILSNQQNSQLSVKNSELRMEPPATTSIDSIGTQKTVTILKTNPAITNLLNTNSFKRSKSTDDVTTVLKDSQEIAAAKRLSLESSNVIKSEPLEQLLVKETTVNTQKPEQFQQQVSINVCSPKLINTLTSKPEDSQNVLLKQLLQNSGSSVASPLNRTVPGIISNQRAPSLGVFSSLEAQLARPVIPPAPAKPIIVSTQVSVTSLTSTILTEVTPKVSSSTKIVSRETSFVSQPTQITTTLTPSVPISIQSLLENKPVVVLNRNDVPASMLMSASSDSGLTGKTLQQQSSMSFETVGMAPPGVGIKKEMISPGGSIRNAAPSPTNHPVLVKSISQSSLGSGNTTPVPFESPLIDVKKEIMDDSSQSESISSDVSMVKNENLVTTPSNRDELMGEILDESPAKTPQEIANELKKKKRREYQKNRRQMQMSKEKGLKKPRKLQKSEEDYDSFMDNLMVHIKALPQMQILEPLLPKNFGVCPIYGCTELNKLSSSKRYNISSGELSGCFGNAELANISDFYNTKPFGLLDLKSEQPPVSTQRGFYDQEFPPIKFEEEDHHRSKYDLLSKDRDIDTPETIVSSSSPECVMATSQRRFPGLILIKEDDENEDEVTNLVEGRMSPSVPTIITPIPIRLKSGMSLSSDNSLSDKENDSKREFGVKSCFGPPIPLKDSNNNNVTVTLTLTSSAAEDIMGVLKSLANILNIPAPTAYQIVERTTTPPSQKLGLYRLRGKDGKEGQPVDIQTILNGTAKFCRHCDVVILNNVIRAKAVEFPLLVNSELESNELYFCGKTCYKQFQWRPINMMDDQNLNTLNDEKSLDVLSDLQKAENPGKFEKNDESFENLKRKRGEDNDDDDDDVELENEDQLEKRQKLMKVKTYSANTFQTVNKQKKMSDRDITEMLFRMNITVNSAPKILDDSRKCIFCHQTGDGVADGPSRLLNYDVDKWVHLNCALWSDGVYETVNGALMNLEPTLQTSLSSQCTMCNQFGATIKCFKARCGSIYHLNCAMKDNCVFYKNKTTMCNIHAPKSEKDNELTTLSVQRRVYIERDENRQVASIMHHSDLTNLMRVGSLILLNVGQLLPHQLQAFHTSNCIYPIGYKIIRFFWSMRHPNKRCRYICYIVDISGRPEFRILVKEVNEEDIELRDETPKKVWQRIISPIAKLRKENQLVQVFPKYVNGEDLFGLTEPGVVRILESLPGVETLTDYRFKYGRNPLLELPLAINPSGAARTEPRIKHNVSWKKPHTQRTGSSSQRPAFVPSTSAGEVACPYSKQFVHSKSSQYKKMKLEWRNNVFLARSKIQGLGLYAARDLEKHTMVIEYIGEVIRGELSELREKQYEAKNRGIYMFRLDEDRVIDATLSGGLARYINHSCNPNCVTEIVEVDREYRIIIFAKRRINRGEELSYDYKFDIEDESRKIACACEAPNCKKYLN